VPTRISDGSLVSGVFPSLIFQSGNSTRLPQDLSKFQTAGTITPAILQNPNQVLTNAIADQTITQHTKFTVSTVPQAVPGGGVANIDFLQGTGGNLNALAFSLTATFWIETVEHKINIGGPLFPLPKIPAPGVAPENKPLVFQTPSGVTFTGTPPSPIVGPRTLTLHSTQIQYSQTVQLNFNGLSWPHVSVATLVPTSSLPIPTSAW
jgi:hypothetical protein